MPACDSCGSSILFGGVKQDGFRFCNNSCAQKAEWIQASRMFPEDMIIERAQQMRQADCPKCGGPGPVEVYTSHKVFSALAFTRWSSHPELCCHSCGQGKFLKHGAFSLLLGWWGFPWGIIMTPVQVGRNLSGLLRMGGGDPEVPSVALNRMARFSLLAERSAQPTANGGAPSPS